MTANYDILLFTETWLQSDILDSEVCDSRYDIFRCDWDLSATNKKTGGGVMIFVKHALRAELNHEWQGSDTVESICITIPCHDTHSPTNLHIAVAYVPPDRTELNSRLMLIKSSMEYLIDKFPSDNFILTGDFNLTGVEWSVNYGGYKIHRSCPNYISEAAVNFLDEMSFLNLNQHNFIRNKKDNILDLCFSNNLISSIIHCQYPMVNEDCHHPSLEITLVDLYIEPIIEMFAPSQL